MRTKQEIEKAVKEYSDKIWYDRHRFLVSVGEFDGNKTPEDIKQKAFAAATMLEEKYGKEKLTPMDDFGWGMLCGKLSALRWILGDEWDNLDS